MELTHQLNTHLKRLRLSGILDTLELRNQQAIQDKLSYVEFLNRLIQDEVEQRTRSSSSCDCAAPHSIATGRWRPLTLASTRRSTVSRCLTSPPVPTSSDTATP